MTREVAKTALDVLSDVELPDVVSAFSFMKGCATYARVPHAESWQLGYAKGSGFPWRVIDRDARRGPGGTENVAFTFSAASTAGIRLEMHTYAKAFRGIGEYRDRGVSIDLMAASRRWPASTSPGPRTIAEHLQHTYRPGMRVRLILFALDPYIDDNELVPAGTCGEITFVDGLGTLHVQWDNGISLGLTHLDRFDVIQDGSTSGEA